ncbi:MAG: helix-turn-helix domain-containing protein [Chitinophagaceae bacterium]
MQTGQHIAAARKSQGMTQEELAAKSSVTVRTIQRIESGESMPRDYTLKAIATALNIDPAIFFPAAPAVNTTNTLQEDDLHFLQMLNLSCFSYVVLPVIYFLVPLFILKKRNSSNPIVNRTGRRMILYQVCWQVATHLLLFLVLIYNLIVAGHLKYRQFHISYLWTALTMCCVNAFIIIVAALRLRKGDHAVYTHTFFKSLLYLKRRTRKTGYKF